MPRHDQVKDEALRDLLAKAHAEMRRGQGTAAVKLLSEAYLAMLAGHPAMLDETIELRPGRAMPAVMRWPALGANLSLQSVMAKKPEIAFTRDRFATSEAITYYEFALDTALAHGL